MRGETSSPGVYAWAMLLQVRIQLEFALPAGGGLLAAFAVFGQFQGAAAGVEDDTDSSAADFAFERLPGARADVDSAGGCDGRLRLRFAGKWKQLEVAVLQFAFFTET